MSDADLYVMAIEGNWMSDPDLHVMAIEGTG